MPEDLGQKEDIMTLNWTRRKFMLVSASGVMVAPLLINPPHLITEAKTDQEVKTAKKENPDYRNHKCQGCNVCSIFYSNCNALNNRGCWCEPTTKELV